MNVCVLISTIHTNTNVFTLIEMKTERRIVTVFGFYISLTFQFHSDMVSIKDQITELINGKQ